MKEQSQSPSIRTITDTVASAAFRSVAAAGDQNGISRAGDNATCTSYSRTKSAEEFLQTSAAIYETLADRVVSLHNDGDRESALFCVQLAANFAWQFHRARFADGTIENIALEIGRELEGVEQTPADRLSNDSHGTNQRRVLHVATAVSPIGGHTRLISNWIENDGASCHSLLLLNQLNPSIPQWLRLKTEASGGTTTSFPSNWPLLEKARRFARICRCPG